MMKETISQTLSQTLSQTFSQLFIQSLSNIESKTTGFTTSVVLYLKNRKHFQCLHRVSAVELNLPEGGLS
jgi:hypothetical protein